MSSREGATRRANQDRIGLSRRYVQMTTALEVVAADPRYLANLDNIPLQGSTAAYV